MWHDPPALKWVSKWCDVSPSKNVYSWVYGEGKEMKVNGKSVSCNFLQVSCFEWYVFAFILLANTFC